MSLYQKLKLLVRATAEEPARKLVELNDIKIFEQELIDLESAIKTAKLQLANVKAEAKSLNESISELSGRVALREQQTLQAMDKDVELAQELAAEIAEDEVSLREQQAQLRQLQKLETKMTDDLKQAVRLLQGHYRKLQIVKASQHGLKQAQLFSGNGQSLNGALREVRESMASIQSRQLRARYLDEAEGEVEVSLSGQAIEQRLDAAGIRTGKHDAMAVLERLKLKKSA